LRSDLDHDGPDSRDRSGLVLNGKVVHHPVAGFFSCGEIPGNLEAHRLAGGKHALKLRFNRSCDITQDLAYSLAQVIGCGNAVDFGKCIVEGDIAKLSIQDA